MPPTPGVDYWAACRGDLTADGMDRLIEDYDNKAFVLPDRTGGPGRISREDFAAGWIAHLLRSHDYRYLSRAGRVRLHIPRAA
jgi:hypothetical protein